MVNNNYGDETVWFHWPTEEYFNLHDPVILCTTKKPCGSLAEDCNDLIHIACAKFVKAYLKHEDYAYRKSDKWGWELMVSEFGWHAALPN